MARTPKQGAPGQLPQGSPADLYQMTDIRVVMVEMGKLTERIENLTNRVGELKDDGKETRDKLDEVKLGIASFKGAMKVWAGLFALGLVLIPVILGWYLKG